MELGTPSTVEMRLTCKNLRHAASEKPAANAGYETSEFYIALRNGSDTKLFEFEQTGMLKLEFEMSARTSSSREVCVLSGLHEVTIETLSGKAIC